uniref:Trafficking protein particle complex subunit n=1 Tax=Daphnia magna TaxID=35525 RepID=A0A0P6GFC0_9CRUS
MCIMSTTTQPVITYSGDTQLFSTLESATVQGLPQETVEWKRSYGRPPRAVTLSASFQPFKIDNDSFKEQSKGLKKLSGAEVLHTYWVECQDIDTYKANVRESIQTWFTQIKQVECSDWLIILVENSDSKKSKQILPRTTVLDKVKNDFGGKTTERCIAVIDPVKGETKSSESWQTFLFRLRQALMAAFSRTLTKFEETVRTQRERRNELNWNFCNYFLLQEELAFAFEMLGLYDEALVQYDELDALFTQFVLNSAVGDAPDWLLAFQATPNNWSGVCLNPKTPFNMELRQKIQNHTMSVIDFRNYLFARQSALLLISSKPAEVARRCLSYVQSYMYELKLLNVNTVDGAIPTWILLTCLQVLSTCQSHVGATGNQSMESFALLWNMAKDKLYELGRKCGLLPGASVGSAELHCVVTLSSGITDFGDESAVRPTPVDKLKEALSSSQAFTRHYLELSELAMGTFKHCGRLRSARLIGRDLSRFYLQLGQPQKSVSFLLDLLRGYQEEDWPLLRIDTHIELAEVFQKIGDRVRFIEASANIAAYPALNAETRMKYFNHLLQSAQDEFRSINCSSMMDLVDIRIHFDTSLEEPFSVLCDSIVRAEVQVVNHFPGPVNCSEVTVTVKAVKNANDEGKPSKAAGKKSVTEKSIDTKGIEKSALATKDKTLSSDYIPIKEQLHLKQDGSLSSVALVCPSAQQLLGRKVSHGLLPTELSVIKEEYTHKLSVKDVNIVPGVNRLTLQMKADHAGTYVLSQFVACSQRLEFIQSVNCPKVSITVVEVMPSVTFIKTRDDLLAGTDQEVELVVRTGSTAFQNEKTLRLCSSRGLMINLPKTDSLFQRELDFVLPPMAAFETVSHPLKIRADLGFTASKEATFVEHKLSVHCPWLSKTPPLLDLPLNVYAPFTVQYKLHTAYTKKFVNIHVQGLTPSSRAFEFQNPNVLLPDATYKNPALSKLEWRNLNGSSQTLKISQDQPANYLWELCGAPAQYDMPLLKAEFSVDYRLAGTTDWKIFSFNFDIVDYATLFTVRSRVEPVKGNDFLRAGSLCHMTLTVSDVLQQASSAALMYEVLADQALWAVCGRTAGVFSMEGSSKHSVTLDVMPLVCGFLPLPAVRLSRYIPAEQKPKETNRKADLAAATLPRLEPFGAGQVYNWSKAQQVHVLAAPSNNGPTSFDTSTS